MKKHFTFIEITTTQGMELSGLKQIRQKKNFGVIKAGANKTDAIKEERRRDKCKDTGKQRKKNKLLKSLGEYRRAPQEDAVGASNKGSGVAELAGITRV